jgi:hypothetical protein
MKKLSIEEKAKRYDEAIEIAKEINNEQRAQPFNIMTRVFPELAESEVKEVDLEKELCTYLEVVKATDEDIDFVDFAKHFFELGQNDIQKKK